MHLILSSTLILSACTLKSALANPSEGLKDRIFKDLSPKLSHGASITFEGPPRWSTFHAPIPAVVVNVHSEDDVAATVRFCSQNDIKFLAQNGGNGWATTFDLHKDGVLINLAALNQVTFNADKTQATIGGGVTVNDTIKAASNAGVLVQTGNCNCVGTLGAILGGGYGNLLGLYGFGVDSIISMRVVNADGTISTVTSSSNPDLFWALRGAGPNFGIVTSAVVKSYPVRPEGHLAWAGGLVFTQDKLERVVQVIEEINLQPDMVAFLYLASSGPPTNEPIVLVTPFLYKGNSTSGHAAFAKLYALDPVADTTKVIPYTQWNSAADVFCTRGPRKPSYSAGFQKMVPQVWRKIWNLYVDFQSRPGAENSVILLETYSWDKARSVPSTSAAFPHRGVNYNGIVISWYNDSTLDQEAIRFGSSVRDLWQSSDGLENKHTYINFANGDERLNDVYGENYSRLRRLKKLYDPKERFNQWFNLG